MTTALLHLGRTGAGPQLTLELARAMLKAGEDLCVIYSADAEIASEFAALDCPTAGVSTFTSLAGAVVGLARIPQLGRTIDRFLSNHDVSTVVITMEQVWQAFLARSFARQRRVLLFVHDASAHAGEGGIVKARLTAAQRRHADGAIVLSQHVEDSLLRSGEFSADRLWRTVHPAFETPDVAPRTLKIGTPVIGFFGRMSKYKGLDLGVETVSELRRRGYSLEFRVVGSGIPLDIPGITADGNVLEDRWVPQDEIAPTLSGFDLLLLPYVEASQSGVLAYAMALGIPSVVTPVGGLVEQAQETKAAIVADTVSATALADAVSALLDNPDAYAQISSNALASARQAFSWKRTAQDVVRAVRNLTHIDR